MKGRNPGLSLCRHPSVVVPEGIIRVHLIARTYYPVRKVSVQREMSGHNLMNSTTWCPGSGAQKNSGGNHSGDTHKNVTASRCNDCPDYSREFKQQFVATSTEPGVSISKLALENSMNSSLLLKWCQQPREGKLPLPSPESPQQLPVTLDAPAALLAEQPELPAEVQQALNISCEVTFRHGMPNLNLTGSESLLTRNSNGAPAFIRYKGLTGFWHPLCPTTSSSSGKAVAVMVCLRRSVPAVYTP